MVTGKVLVVDDMVSMRLVVRDMLEEMGFSDIKEAVDGSSALEILKRERVDLVVSDFNMSPQTGLELLREIKTDPTLKDIPFILVTSETDESIAHDARQMGVSAFMKKPIHFGAFRDNVTTVVSSE